MSIVNMTKKEQAHSYRQLQAAALIKLFEEGRLDELNPDKPIAPYDILSDVEIEKASDCQN